MQALGLCALLMTGSLACAAARPPVLQYGMPAKVWTEALPIGNGTMGAMVFGGVDEELIQLNEATLWSGGPEAHNVNPRAFEFLAPARRALARGEYGRAADLVKNMQGYFTESFLPAGDLVLRQRFASAVKPGAYRRQLILRDAITRTTFTVDGVRYQREVFASAPAQLMVLRLTASKSGSISVTVNLRSALRASVSASAGTLILHGRAPSHVDPNYVRSNVEPVVYDTDDDCRGMRFELRVVPRVEGGSTMIDGDTVQIERANALTLLVSVATSFNGSDRCPFREGRDESRINEQRLAAAANSSWARLRRDHINDFRNYFDRVAFELNPGEADRSGEFTDARLEAYGAGADDAALEALYFQFGRYLLISSSRTPNAPANLQGIWSKDLRPPWSSNYTTNINVQMNYWPVESANLSEMFTPMIGWIQELARNGTHTAQDFYRARGWVLHHNSDIWAHTDPVGEIGKGDPKWANWYMGANWIARHLWEHYLFTGDRAFLREAYPVMRGAAEFSLDWLQADPDGHLVTTPSTSPENEFFYEAPDGRRQQGKVAVASTMDMGIIHDLFANVIAAAEVLGMDADLSQRLARDLPRLSPFRIGAQGQLQEWQHDLEDVDPHHRHVSHLYALYPGHAISPLATPELAAASRKTLELRGDEGTGWSLAWKVNIWARLLDGNRAHVLFRNLLRLTRENDTRYDGHGGVYPNLFDAHPPFQIDGNLGGTAGVIELLLQSQNGELQLLPALPDEWPQGRVTGLVGRGAFVVDIDWRSGKLARAKILARLDGPCAIRAMQPFAIRSLGLRSASQNGGYTLVFTARAGQRYLLEAN